MSNDDALLAAAVAAFESAALEFASARIALQAVVDQSAPIGPARDYEPDLDDGACRHVDAVEVSTLGDRGPVWLCPDCGDQFE